jgi:5'-3' exonuclease
MSKTLIDGDIIAYRCAFAHKDDPIEAALEGVDEIMEYIFNECSFYNPTGEYEVYITGKNNFRNNIAVTHKYKGNRKDADKPVHLVGIREYLVRKYMAICSKGEEADDLIGIEATRVGPKVVIASADKDMLQLAAYHFNFNKNEWKTVDATEGLQFFYTQILTGDTADNIKGLYRVGPVKAEKILKGITEERELWNTVVEAYDKDVDRVLENARLLWLRRYEGEIWEPPHQRKPKAA